MTDSLLAQLDKLPEGYLVSWLIAFGGLALVAQLVLNLVDRFRAKSATHAVISPDPLQVKGVKELATREELESIKQDIDSDLEGMRAAMAESERKSHGEIVAIHSRINQVAENTSAMKGRLDEIAQSLHELIRRSMK